MSRLQTQLELHQHSLDFPAIEEPAEGGNSAFDSFE